ISLALKHGHGSLMIMPKEKYEGISQHEPRHFSKNLMCPTSGISYDDPAPNFFSFNSPYGACHKCNGIGQIAEVDYNKIIPNPSKSIKQGGLAPLGEYQNKWIFQQVESILKKYGYTLSTPIKDISEDAVNVILYGTTS